MPVSQIAFSAGFMVLLVATAMVHYSFPGRFAFLSEFPTENGIRLASIDAVAELIAWCVANSVAVFGGLTAAIRRLLDAIEVALVQTPWIVVAALIVPMTWLTAGLRMAIWSDAFLAYMGLLGTAALLAIVIGIPLGMFSVPVIAFFGVENA